MFVWCVRLKISFTAGGPAPCAALFGHDWMIGHAIEEVAPEERQWRYTEMLAGEQGE
jgi:hypothetical protein